MTGLVIGVPQTFNYFAKMQERIVDFVIRTSGMKKKVLTDLMNSTDVFANDIGTILVGKEAVENKLINEVGGLNKALIKLKDLIDLHEKEDNAADQTNLKN